MSNYVTDTVLSEVLIGLRDEVLSMTPPSNNLVEYTVVIDQNNSNPETSCTYADDAVFMYPGDLWDTKPIFKDIKPCVFKNGEVVYYLNPNDWTKRIDGTASDLTGVDGDVMIEFPKCAYRIYTDANDIVYVSVTNDPDKVIADNRYSYDAFSRLILGDRNKIYIGAFPGYINNNNILTSIAGLRPTTNKTILQCRDAAHAAGEHYQQFTWAQLKLLQCLYLIKYKNRNGQQILGQGLTNTSGYSYVCGYETYSQTSITNDNSTFTKGMFFGDILSQSKHMRCFGLEDLWGNINIFVDGITSDNTRNVIVSWNDFTGENIETTSTIVSTGLTSNRLLGYTKFILGTTDTGFLPKNNNTGSSSTYWTDESSLSASCVLTFGDNYNSGQAAGPFCVILGNSASVKNAATGARLTYV